MQLYSSERTMIMILVTLAKTTKRINKSTLAGKIGVSASSLNYYCGVLVEKGVIDSRIGVGGGYQLLVDPGTINMKSALRWTQQAREREPNKTRDELKFPPALEREVNELMREMTLDELL